MAKAANQDILRIAPQRKLLFRENPEDSGSFEAHLDVTNPLRLTVGFKVKTTRPEWYYVTPNQALITPGTSSHVTIRLHRKNMHTQLRTWKALVRGDEDPSGQGTKPPKRVETESGEAIDRFMVQSVPLKDDFVQKLQEMGQDDQSTFLSKTWGKLPSEAFCYQRLTCRFVIPATELDPSSETTQRPQEHVDDSPQHETAPQRSGTVVAPASGPSDDPAGARQADNEEIEEEERRGFMSGGSVVQHEHDRDANEGGDGAWGHPDRGEEHAKERRNNTTSWPSEIYHSGSVPTEPLHRSALAQHPQRPTESTPPHHMTSPFSEDGYDGPIDFEEAQRLRRNHDMMVQHSLQRDARLKELEKTLEQTRAEKDAMEEELEILRQSEGLRHRGGEESPRATSAAQNDAKLDATRSVEDAEDTGMQFSLLQLIAVAVVMFIIGRVIA